MIPVSVDVEDLQEALPFHQRQHASYGQKYWSEGREKDNPSPVADRVSLKRTPSPIAFSKLSNNITTAFDER